MIECDAPGRLIEGLRQTAPAARDLGTADNDITFGPPLLVGDPAAERQPRLRRELIGALRTTRDRVGALFRDRARTAAGQIGSAHARTPVTHAQPDCRPLPQTQKL